MNRKGVWGPSQQTEGAEVGGPSSSPGGVHPAVTRHEGDGARTRKPAFFPRRWSERTAPGSVSTGRQRWRVALGRVSWYRTGSGGWGRGRRAALCRLWPIAHDPQSHSGTPIPGPGCRPPRRTGKSFQARTSCEGRCLFLNKTLGKVVSTGVLLDPPSLTA